MGTATAATKKASANSVVKKSSKPQFTTKDNNERIQELSAKIEAQKAAAEMREVQALQMLEKATSAAESANGSAKQGAEQVAAFAAESDRRLDRAINKLDEACDTMHEMRGSPLSRLKRHNDDMAIARSNREAHQKGDAHLDESLQGAVEEFGGGCKEAIALYEQPTTWYGWGWYYAVNIAGALAKLGGAGAFGYGAVKLVMLALGRGK